MPLSLERAQKYDMSNAAFNKEELYSEQGVLQALLRKMQTRFYCSSRFFIEVSRTYFEMNFQIVLSIFIRPYFRNMAEKECMACMFMKRWLQITNTETGITIHYVNENYDEGAIIFQNSTAVVTKMILQKWLQERYINWNMNTSP